MKKSFIITLAISLISMGVKAQSLDKLIGNWEFSSVYNVSKLDAGTVKKTKDMYEGSQMYFYEDGSYYFSNSTKDEDGTYTLAGKTISTKDESGKISKIEIIELTDDTLSLKIGSMSIVLKRIVEEELEDDGDYEEEDSE